MRNSTALAAALVVVTLSSCDCSVEPLAPTRPKMALVEELEFGPIGEGTSVTQPATIVNDGDGELDVSVSLARDGSADFTIDGDTDFKIEPRGSVDVTIRFSPVGVGEDVSDLVVTGNDGDGRIHIHGGPIEPVLSAPEVVDFAPADASIVAKSVTLTNAGLAILHIESTAPDAAANPQFAAPDAPFDVDLAPQESVTFDVQYARSTRQDHGRLLVRSNDPGDAAAGGVRAVDLVPDYLRECEDGDDNDGDLLADFPNDPGCSGPHDDTEQNAADCVPTATRPCGNGVCAGVQTCSDAGAFGDCDGDPGLAGAEVCNGVDDDCDGTRDNDVPPAACTVAGCPGHQTCVPNSTTPGGEPGVCIADDPNCTAVLCGNGVVDDGEECDHGGNNGSDGLCSATCQDVGGSCDPDGTWAVDTEVVYACCFFVDIDAATFTIAGNGASATPLPRGNGMQADPHADCSADGDFSLSLAGGCTETYSLTGDFTDADTFVGTYTADFTGNQCDCFGGSVGTPCVSQSFPVTLTRQ